MNMNKLIAVAAIAICVAAASSSARADVNVDSLLGESAMWLDALSSANFEFNALADGLDTVTVSGGTGFDLTEAWNIYQPSNGGDFNDKMRFQRR